MFANLLFQSHRSIDGLSSVNHASALSFEWRVFDWIGGVT
jgi:hypothetical protein